MDILIIEDDKAVVENLRSGLLEKGFNVSVAFDGKSGLEQARMGKFDVLIVDRMLPKLDGLSLVKTLRYEGNETPTLILTALSEVDDTVEGFEAGCDDYLAKPFALPVLVARIKALAKRQHPHLGQQNVVTIADLTIDKINRTAVRDGNKLHLQPKEFDVLAFLILHRGEAVTRSMLLEHVWGVEFDPQTNIVDVHISRLRQKVDKGFRDPIISTVRGIGYTIEE